MEALFAAFGLDGTLLLVQVVNFGILIVALWFLLYKPVLKMLSERQALVQKGVEDALAATQKLEGADTEVSAKLSQADAQAGEILTSARDAANEEKARIMKEAEARAASSLKDAEARAAEASARALRESEKEVARLAVLAAEKVLRERA